MNHEEAEKLEARKAIDPENSERITGKVAGDVTIAEASDSYGLLKKREHVS